MFFGLWLEILFLTISQILISSIICCLRLWKWSKTFQNSCSPSYELLESEVLYSLADFTPTIWCNGDCSWIVYVETTTRYDGDAAAFLQLRHCFFLPSYSHRQTFPSLFACRRPDRLHLSAIFFPPLRPVNFPPLSSDTFCLLIPLGRRPKPASGGLFPQEPRDC